MRNGLFYAISAIVGITIVGSLRAQTYDASSAERENLGAKYAFDGDKATRWSASFKEKTGWIEVTFADAKKFSEVKIFSGVRDLKGAPKDFDILAGESREKLKLVKAVKGTTTDDTPVKFDAVTAKVWRIEVKSVIDARWSPTITEIEFGPKDDAAPTKTDDAPTGARKFSASDPGTGAMTPEKAFDGDPMSHYESSQTGKETWIASEWPAPQTFNAVRIFVRSEGGRGCPRDFTVQAKTGSSWTTVGKVVDNWSGAPTLRFKSTTSKEWRIVATKIANPKFSLRMSECEFLSVDGDSVPAFPDAAAPKESEVNAAIERGMKWLQKERGADGNWKTPHTEEFPMGVMSLCGLVLRKSGTDADAEPHPDLVSRLAAMSIAKEKTYSVALYAVYLRSLSIKKYNDRIKECADFLIKHQGPDGLWGYPEGRTDLSNAQFALLGLKAASEVGIEIPSKVWSKALDYLVDGTERDGGFNYVPTGPSANEPCTGSMTAAGLACLKICVDHLTGDAGAVGRAKKSTESAMAWLEKRFVVEMNPASDQSHYYYLYAVERVGAYYGKKDFGDRPWYALGARHLLDFQSRDGSWHGNIEDTCFALLFLNRASISGQ